MIKAIPNVTFVEMAHNHECAHCCGSVLTLLKEPQVAAGIGRSRLDEAADAGAEKVLALCPCCEFPLRVSAEATHSPVEVVDLAHFAAEALGVTLPDPHPEVRAQWAVFEAMIKLMTPEGFAQLMGTMWPELIAAMPLGMGQMMRAMGKVDGALDAMRPMFPVLFPQLLPLMLPKIMPTMLSRIAQMVPMPDYMATQMPDLMSKVMGCLMLHTIGEVVPLATDPMIAYLQTAARWCVPCAAMDVTAPVAWNLRLYEWLPDGRWICLVRCCPVPTRRPTRTLFLSTVPPRWRMAQC
jgi:Cysteine-rich domain